MHHQAKRGGLAATIITLAVTAGIACASGDTPSPATGTPDTAASPSSTSPSSTIVAPATTTAEPTLPGQPEPLRELALERVFRWYDPERPTHMAEAPDGTGRFFVSEQAGRLFILSGDPLGESGTAVEALDIRDKVSTQNTEEGFLGFALHPQFGQNGRLFVYYSAASPRRSVISEFHVSGDTIDPESERTIMVVSQPAGNHNGGMLIFGPDSYLYISLGDGGGAGDRSGNAQNLATVLGSILRIDVNTPGVPYGIPPDNPFASGQAPGGGAAAPETWAYGLRNPWRLAFDTVTGDLWAADVGQNRVEEVDLIVRGGNYGWNFKEGPDCFQPPSGCEAAAPDNLIEPVTSYSRTGGNCSIVGGYVYRGSRLPSLYGAYIYGDFCSGTIQALRYANGAAQEHIELVRSGFQIPSFGQGLDSEVYVLTYQPGIYRFVEP